MTMTAAVAKMPSRAKRDAPAGSATPADPDRAPTPEELRRVLDEGGVEFVDGEIVEKNVGRKSSKTGHCVHHHLGAAAGDADVEVYDSTMSYRCFPDQPDRRRKPDVSAIRVARLREAGIPDDRDFGESVLPPDLAVEVVSPKDRIYAVRGKIREYLDAGFGEIWLLFPAERAADVYRGGDLLRLGPDDELALPDLLPKFRVKVADLFPSA